MGSLIEKLYFKSPVFFQNMMVSAYGYKLYRERYIGNHDVYLERLLRSQWYDQETIDRLVDTKFKAIFSHAISTVPYYRGLVKSGKINPDAVEGVSDIGRLPVLTKEQIRENPELFISDKYNKESLIKIGTSGTTGKTLRIYVDKDSRRHAYAFFSRLKAWMGVSARGRNVTFAGRTIVDPDAEKPPFWRINKVSNNYLFSSYHITQRNLEHYIHALEKIQPEYIDSYPSSIYLVAQYMLDNDIKGIRPKAIITSSETLLDHQRELIEQAFGCPVFDQYGAAEQVVFVSQCEKGAYHNNPEYGYIEYLNEKGENAQPGESARLICTGFTNMAMPLIRYDIGDTGILSDKKCACGRNFPVIEKIVGRTDDMLVMKDGRVVGRLDPVFKGLETIVEAQIIQEDYDNITLNIVPASNYKEDDAVAVIAELKKRLGSDVNIHVNQVSEIARTKNGKFRAVITKIGKSQ